MPSPHFFHSIMCVLAPLRETSSRSCPPLLVVGLTQLPPRTTALWSMIEPTVGIVAASLPTLRPLFKKLRQTGSGAIRAPAPGPEPVNHRSRAQGTKPRGLELSTREMQDVVDGEPGVTVKHSESTVCRETTLWSACVERGYVLELPPPMGISIHTAIEVSTSSRDSSGSRTWPSYGPDV